MLMVNCRTTALALLLVVSGCAGSRSDVMSSGGRAVPDSEILSAADATREAGRYAEALQIYQRVLVDKPSLAGARYGAAECELALGQPDNAAALFAGLVSS